MCRTVQPVSSTARATRAGAEGYKVTTTGYKNGSLAVQDLINGNINYVVIDSAPAKCITEAINKMQ